MTPVDSQHLGSSPEHSCVSSEPQREAIIEISYHRAVMGLPARDYPCDEECDENLLNSREPKLALCKRLLR